MFLCNCARETSQDNVCMSDSRVNNDVNKKKTIKNYNETGGGIFLFSRLPDAQCVAWF